MPDLTWPATRYVASTRAEDADTAEGVILQLLREGRFHREQEWLHLCRAGLFMRRHPSLPLAGRFGEIALDHEHELVRARALLAWGKLSADDDFAVADAYWLSAGQTWRPYVLIALQQKDRTERDNRYEAWSGEGRYLRDIADAVQARPFPWATL